MSTTPSPPPPSPIPAHLELVTHMRRVSGNAGSVWFPLPLPHPARQEGKSELQGQATLRLLRLRGWTLPLSLYSALRERDRRETTTRFTPRHMGLRWLLVQLSTHARTFVFRVSVMVYHHPNMHVLTRFKKHKYFRRSHDGMYPTKNLSAFVLLKKK